MAESPASWTPLERAINEAIRQHDKGLKEGRIGWSLTKQIAEHLRNKGFVRESLVIDAGPALHPDGYPVDEMGG